MPNLPIKGAAELVAHLSKLGEKAEVKVMRSAVSAGAKVFRDAARRASTALPISPFAVNRLRDAIRHRRSRGKPGVVSAGLFIASSPAGKRKSDDPAAWWLWFDKGTAERFRGSRSKVVRAIRAATGTRKGFTGRITATHWLTVVFELAGGAALGAVTDQARKRIEKELAK